MDKKLKKILIKTKKAVFSQKIGNNTSKFKGEGYDFIELREYEDGEDIRKIDWVISAKMRKPYVKVFYAQRELDVNIVPILGGSVYFGTKKFKQELISEVCSIIGYSCSAQGDNYTSFIANEDATLHTKKTKKILNVANMVHGIYNYDVKGKSVDYKNIVDQLFRKIKKKSIIFLIGDFFNTNDLNLKLLAKKHEVIAIIIRDRFEESPSVFENINFTDPSTFKSFDGNIGKESIKEYEKIVKNNDEKLYENLKSFGVDFIKVYTDDNIYTKLFQLFK